MSVDTVTGSGADIVKRWYATHEYEHACKSLPNHFEYLVETTPDEGVIRLTIVCWDRVGQCDRQQKLIVPVTLPPDEAVNTCLRMLKDNFNLVM